MELLERLDPLEPRIDARRSNGKFFPPIPDDSVGFGDLKVVSGSDDPEYLSQDVTPRLGQAMITGCEDPNENFAQQFTAAVTCHIS